MYRRNSCVMCILKVNKVDVSYIAIAVDGKKAHKTLETLLQRKFHTSQYLFDRLERISCQQYQLHSQLWFRQRHGSGWPRRQPHCDSPLWRQNATRKRHGFYALFWHRFGILLFSQASADVQSRIRPSSLCSQALWCPQRTERIIQVIITPAKLSFLLRLLSSWGLRLLGSRTALKCRQIKSCKG